ncbi:regulatory signaling modulator protein AmpE [Stenotrophomonas mori]|uniref:Regulatory signaling modulator protein AmpE n=1 Tax=Stenotrophomonas mori TaxID=2871096 RepID=A0ABT0SJ57_9GAMM|nr:regulatory signaling modulator protein AmpE [Stenotrophomonas mori]MCL7715367.1 regulatory signaling modulator protein AmpE [Stenotrophomonas mori]
MFTTLVAVIAALVLGHLAPVPMTVLRDWHWFGRWRQWLQARLGADGRAGLWWALVPCVALVAVLQWLLAGRLYGLPSLLFGIAVLVLCWGPRDLDRDVEAVLDAEDLAAHEAAVARLRAGGGGRREEAPTLVDAAFYGALRRWFCPLFWFLLLGPSGAVLYRLLAEAPPVVPADADAPVAGRRAQALLEWPVAQLMALSMALVGNFDTVFSAWRRAGGDRWELDLGFLGEAARAGVGVELAEDAQDAREAGVALLAERHPELRDAMSLVWRMLLLWMALLALMIIAGWVG